MEKVTTISIAKNFSEAPSGRYVSDGPFSGEHFRENLLVPALTTSDLVVIDFDGTIGYGSSFLEEAFGGLVRNHNITAGELKKKIKIIDNRKFYEDRVWSYIGSAKPAKEKK